MILCLIWLICYHSLSITCLYQTIPVIRISVDQSLHSRPDRLDTVRPVPSIIVRGSWRLSVEHCRSNSTRRPLAPSKENFFQLTRSLHIILRKLTYQLLYGRCISYVDGVIEMPTYNWIWSTWQTAIKVKKLQTWQSICTCHVHVLAIMDVSSSDII